MWSLLIHRGNSGSLLKLLPCDLFLSDYQGIFSGKEKNTGVLVQFFGKHSLNIFRLKVSISRSALICEILLARLSLEIYGIIRHGSRENVT